VNLAKSYEFINLPLAERISNLRIVDKYLDATVTSGLPLFIASEDEIWDEEEVKRRLVALESAMEEPLLRTLIQLLIIRLDFYKPGISIKRVYEVWNKISTHIMGLPFSQEPIAAFHTDARNIPLDAATVDLVVTSPPYINVFNYHQQYRASVEAIGWNVLDIARSEFGSNRKHRGNRILTVIQFCLDMAGALQELKRICSSNARLIFIVGKESMVRGTQFFNGEIVAEIAHRALGFNLVLRQEREFVNRYGQRIFEDILHFTPTYKSPEQVLSPIQTAREIALEVLRSVHQTAPSVAKDDVESAIARIEEVQPSPVFRQPYSDTEGYVYHNAKYGGFPYTTW
jgi:hypothetical protein